MKQVILDSKQKFIASKLHKIVSDIQSEGIFTKIIKIFFSINSHKGIYLYGNVGTGKSMLMEQFYSSILISKQILHYQQFMSDLHLKLHDLRSKSRDQAINIIAYNIKRQCRVLCIDEFEIQDITDAMIIRRLFEYLEKYNVFVFITTNTDPDNLYRDGLQRDHFLPCIERIKQKFEILHLDITRDYRLDLLSNIKDRIIFPPNNSQILKIKEQICSKDNLLPFVMEVFGRKLLLKTAYQNILFTDFTELFLQDLGYTDYVEIAKHFKIIILSSVRPITKNENDIATRFINFIDNIYFNRVLLFMEIKCSPEKIYIHSSKSFEFKRTISRLYEMNSQNYPNI